MRARSPSPGRKTCDEDLPAYHREIGDPLFGLLACHFHGLHEPLRDQEYGPLDNLDLKAVKAAGYNVGSSAVAIAPDSDGRSTVVLEVRDGKKHLERIPLPADKATYIGDVVKDAKLTERLGRINLAIMRPTGNNAPPVRMPVEFDSKGKYVMEEQNYSLRSGDHIIVYPDDNSAIDRLLSSMAPWAKTGR